MLSEISQINGNNYNCENSKEIVQDLRDPVEHLVVDVMPNFFVQLNLNLADLVTLFWVSKKWKQLTDTPFLWKSVIYREFAFGNDKWAHCFGKEVVKDENREEEFDSLPWKEFIADCKKFKHFFSNSRDLKHKFLKKKVTDCLMLVRLPKTLNGGLTLKNLGQLAKKYFPNDNNAHTGYSVIAPEIMDKLGDQSLEKSEWVLMTKDVVPGTRNKSPVDQQTVVDDLVKESLSNYELPKALESATCILSQYFFNPNADIFTVKHPWTATRCKDSIEGVSIVVGPVDLKQGLSVTLNNINSAFFGAAALRKKFEVVSS